MHRQVCMRIGVHEDALAGTNIECKQWDKMSSTFLKMRTVSLNMHPAQGRGGGLRPAFKAGKAAMPQ